MRYLLIHYLDDSVLTYEGGDVEYADPAEVRLREAWDEEMDTRGILVGGGVLHPARQGIVDAVTVGPSKLYSLNRDHLAAPCVVTLAGLRDQVIDRLRQRLALWEKPAVYSALFGSAASGQMRTDSDIDVFVVRPDGIADDDPTWVRQLQDLAHDGSRWTGNDLRILEMSEAGATVGLVDEPVLGDIRERGLWLAGPESYLRTRSATPGRRPRR